LKGLAHGLFAVIGAHQTIEVLDISGNGIGDRGLDLLVDCLARNQVITSVKFDGSGLHDSEKFIESCHRLAEMKHLTQVDRPKKDMRELTKKARDPHAIEKAWQDVEKAVGMNALALRHAELNRDDGLAIQVTKRKATWDIEIMVEYNKEENQWRELNDEFSLQRLTGIPPDDSLIDL
jgi:hypothetical protein